MQNYYAGKLNATKLFQVYDTGIERVRQYLEAEIDFVRKDLQGHERILELGAEVDESSVFAVFEKGA